MHLTTRQILDIEVEVGVDRRNPVVGETITIRVSRLKHSRLGDLTTLELGDELSYRIVQTNTGTVYAEGLFTSTDYTASGGWAIDTAVPSDPGPIEIKITALMRGAIGKVKVSVDVEDF